jgi:hypothetical protein
MYFFYLTEQHSQFLWHTVQVLYMCTLCDSTNINTIIEFVPNCLFWFVPSVPGYMREEEEHKPDPWPNPIEINQMGLHCVWKVVKTPSNIFNNSVYLLFLIEDIPLCLKHINCYSTIGHSFRPMGPSTKKKNLKISATIFLSFFCKYWPADGPWDRK